MRRWRRLPVAVRFLVLHGATGFGLAGLLVAAPLWGDPAGVASLLLRFPAAVALLWLFLGLSLGGVQIAAAVMRLGAPEPPRGGDARLEPVRVSPPSRRSRG